MFKKKEWDQFLSIGNRENSFDWDIPSGFITFGTYGMTVHKFNGKTNQWCQKTVNDWRNKTYREVNLELKTMAWE